MGKSTERSNTTDKLVIDIKVNVKKGATTQITNLTKSLAALNEVVKKTANIERYANALKTIGKELTRTTSNKKAQLGGENLLETQETNTQKAILKNKTQIYHKASQIQNVTKQTFRIQQQQAKAVEKVNKAKKKGLDVDKKTNKESKKSSSFFGNFAKSIGRIALYRAIRAGLSAIVKYAKEGLAYFVQYDNATNKAMSNIINSGNQVKATLGATLGTIVKQFEPIITSLSDLAVDLVNNLNMALAVMQGDDYYYKAIKNNEDYAKSLKKTNNELLSFDKFESLSKKSDQEYERVGITDEEKNNTEDFVGTLNTIKNIVSEIATYWYGIFKELDDMGFISFLKDALIFALNTVQKIYEWINKAVNWLKEQGWSELLILPFTGLLGIIFLVRKHWEDIANFFTTSIKAIGNFFTNLWVDIANGFATAINFISNMFIGMVNFWIAQINWLLKPIDRIARIFGGDGVQLGMWNANVNWRPYADGGMVEKGTRFIAGEAGAEVVHTSARGTGVTNTDQFAQAMLQALATYGVARGSDVSFKGDVYINQTKAGQLLESSVYGEGVRVGHFRKA